MFLQVFHKIPTLRGTFAQILTLRDNFQPLRHKKKHRVHSRPLRFAQKPFRSYRTRNLAIHTSKCDFVASFLSRPTWFRCILSVSPTLLFFLPLSALPAVAATYKSLFFGGDQQTGLPFFPPQRGDYRRILQHFSRSTRLTILCTAQISKFQPKSRHDFADSE